MRDMEIAAVSALSGLQQAQERLNKAAAALSSPDNPVDSVSLSTEAVNLLQAKNQFAVGIATLKILDETQKEALNLLLPKS